ncbi:MAG TPA: hypothetical protein PKY50_18385, partial [Candidatus Competibacter sp.]|nr:hypothetical protein [Candidatus Competibacter sp.]
SDHEIPRQHRPPTGPAPWNSGFDFFALNTPPLQWSGANVPFFSRFYPFLFQVYSQTPVALDGQ